MNNEDLELNDQEEIQEKSPLYKFNDFEPISFIREESVIVDESDKEQ